MRFHVVNVPQSCTTKVYSMCGFSQKAINFCWLLKSRGHEVFLYGGETNEADCTEHVICISEEDRKDICGFQPFIYPTWNAKHPAWERYNAKVAKEINARKQEGDFVCVLGGNCHKALEALVPDLKVVEYGIGYTGYFAKYKVWESHVWRAFCLGKHFANAPVPSANDTVIPAFYDQNDYAIGQSGGYVLFLGRVTTPKGVQMACNAARMAGKRLLVAGWGDKKLVGEGAEYLGAVDHKRKLELLSGADWLICPTQGIEPFGNVSCEAQLSGVPVISTNWGGFTETVVHGFTGWRCDSLDEMAAAFRTPVALSRRAIRDRAIAQWSRQVAAQRYDHYFRRLSSMPTATMKSSSE